MGIPSDLDKCNSYSELNNFLKKTIPEPSKLGGRRIKIIGSEKTVSLNDVAKKFAQLKGKLGEGGNLPQDAVEVQKRIKIINNNLNLAFDHVSPMTRGLAKLRNFVANTLKPIYDVDGGFNRHIALNLSHANIPNKDTDYEDYFNNLKKILSSSYAQVDKNRSQYSPLDEENPIAMREAYKEAVDADKVLDFIGRVGVEGSKLKDITEKSIFYNISEDPRFTYDNLTETQKSNEYLLALLLYKGPFGHFSEDDKSFIIEQWKLNEPVDKNDLYKIEIKKQLGLS